MPSSIANYPCPSSPLNSTRPGLSALAPALARRLPQAARILKEPRLQSPPGAAGSSTIQSECHRMQQGVRLSASLPAIIRTSYLFPYKSDYRRHDPHRTSWASANPTTLHLMLNLLLTPNPSTTPDNTTQRSKHPAKRQRKQNPPSPAADAANPAAGAPVAHHSPPLLPRRPLAEAHEPPLLPDDGHGCPPQGRLAPRAPRPAPRVPLVRPRLRPRQRPALLPRRRRARHSSPAHARRVREPGRARVRCVRDGAVRAAAEAGRAPVFLGRDEGLGFCCAGFGSTVGVAERRVLWCVVMRGVGWLGFGYIYQVDQARYIYQVDLSEDVRWEFGWRELGALVERGRGHVFIIMFINLFMGASNRTEHIYHDFAGHVSLSRLDSAAAANMPAPLIPPS